MDVMRGVFCTTCEVFFKSTAPLVKYEFECGHITDWHVASEYEDFGYCPDCYDQGFPQLSPTVKNPIYVKHSVCGTECEYTDGAARWYKCPTCGFFYDCP